MCQQALDAIASHIEASGLKGGTMTVPSNPGKHGVYVPPRFQQGPIKTALQLGPLAPLIGSWKGNGFNCMWRPHNKQSQPVGDATKRFLELNLTSETLDFFVIPGVVPNRGLDPQVDLNLYGLHYLQRVTDADPPPFQTAGQALHIEPGLFMSVPASDLPQNGPTIVRMASIPHGVTLLMQGPTPPTAPVAGPPVIPSIYPIAGLPTFTPQAPPGCTLVPSPPIQGLGIQPTDIPPPAGDGAEHKVPEVTVACDVAGSLSNGPFPPPFQPLVDDPNSLLRSAIAGQDILGNIKIQLSTGLGSNLSNIPFLGTPNPAQPSAPSNNPNAFVYSSAATFWIEWVRVPDQPPQPKGADPTLQSIEPYWPTETYLQLQYSQVSILVFNNVLWPHVNVATLTLSAG
jgi:hypothetical protein